MTTLSSSKTSRAFSILELLSVMTVVAILMAMIIPAIGAGRRQFNILKTKSQLQRYTLALENYRAEYGAYPSLGVSPIAINATPHQFVELLTAHAIDGSAPTETTAVALNPNAITFAEFTSDEITPKGLVIDAFDNTDISLYLDADADGFLDNLEGIRGTVGWRSGDITTW